jgi:hypothetical protein
MKPIYLKRKAAEVWWLFLIGKGFCVPNSVCIGCTLKMNKGSMHMQIKNTVPDFIDLFRNELTELKVADLAKYYGLHPEIFEEYFTYHCPKTEERLSNAILKYPNVIENIQMISRILPGIIEEVCDRYREIFGFKEDLKFNLLVGGFGSNAFVERKIVGEVYFAVEKLSPDPDHLRVIVAHEIGHVFHNVVSNEKGMDWSKVDWTNGIMSLYREGVATYASKRIVPGQTESVYYSYDNDGESWYEFYCQNKETVKSKFLEDCREGWDFEKEREWFRLSGGSYFGFNRLGYFLGTSFVEDLVEEVGEQEAFTYWIDLDIKNKLFVWQTLHYHENF